MVHNLRKKTLKMLQKATFSPPIYLKNRHVQSIMNSLGPRKIRAAQLLASLDSERLILTAKDGTRLLADHDRSHVHCRAVVILLHGWEGSSNSAYQVTTAKYLLDHSFDVLRLNLRDHGDSHHLNRDFFNSTMTQEVADVIESFLQMHRYEQVFMAGFSLGGNFTLRIAADHGRALGLDAVVAISPPVDPVNAMLTINKTLFIYRRYFLRRWTRSLRKKLHYFPEHGSIDELSAARTLDQINATFIPKFTPFPNPTAYFTAYGITGDRLAALDLPAYLIAAADDPVVPSEDITKINAPQQLTIDVQSHGGHCGFIQNLSAESWIEARLVDIFNGYRTANQAV